MARISAATMDAEMAEIERLEEINPILRWLAEIVNRATDPAVRDEYGRLWHAELARTRACDAVDQAITTTRSGPCR